MLLNYQKGSSLYFSIIILSILLAIALGLGAILVGQSRVIKGMGDSVAAFYAADTGIEQVLYYDKLCRQTGCGSGLPVGFQCKDETNCDEGLEQAINVPGSVGSATYKTTFDDGAPTITSIGMYSGTRRAIRVDR